MNSKHAFWPRRYPTELTPPATSLWHNLAVSALRYPDKPAMVYFGQAWTYTRFKSACEKLAGHLRRLRVGRGDRVLLDMQNCPQLEIAFYAILRLDAVVVPVNPMNKADELTHYIVDADARVAITTADLCPVFEQANDALAAEQRLRHLVVTHLTDAFDAARVPEVELPTSWRDWLLAEHPVPAMASIQVHDWSEVLGGPSPDDLPEVVAGPDDLAVLPYTSGTTGLPKGCMHTHGTMMHSAVNSALWSQGTPQNVSLGVAPMFHVSGMVSSMHTTIYLGGTQILMPRWNREVAGHLITKWGVTHWSNIPTMIIDLLASPRGHEFDLSSLCYIAGGGATMPEAIAQRLLEQYGLRYVEGYGLTETASGVHGNPPDAPKSQCLGIPMFGARSLILDQATLAEVAPGESGEIVIHSPQLFLGYWKNPEATTEAFLEIDGKRYFRSGDIGRVDKDGYFFMTDRLKRMINASGFKVWPAEVEALMYRHPAIQEVCVVGTKDSYRGESVKAFVVLKDPQGRGTRAEDIVGWCREHMAVYKAPSTVEFVDGLPKSSSGKVLWRTLQDDATAAASPA